MKKNTECCESASLGELISSIHHLSIYLSIWRHLSTQGKKCVCGGGGVYQIKKVLPEKMSDWFHKDDSYVNKWDSIQQFKMIEQEQHASNPRIRDSSLSGFPIVWVLKGRAEFVSIQPLCKCCLQNWFWSERVMGTFGPQEGQGRREKRSDPWTTF